MMSDYSRTIDTVYLERTLNELRNEMVREPGESIENYMKRTWLLALERVHANTPPLPRVVEQHARSKRLLAVQEKYGIAPGQASEKENEDE